MGGNRHQRRLYEAVVADGSCVVGRTLDELLDLEQLLDPADGLEDPYAEKYEGPLSKRRNEGFAPLESIRGIASTSRAEILSAAPWFLRLFRGYPLAVCRRREDQFTAMQPLSPEHDAICQGDMILIDAFEEFPSLDCTPDHFLISSEVLSSQAPRHGRLADQLRGAFAISGLLVCVLLEDIGLVNIFVSTSVLVSLLFMTQTVHATSMKDILDWRLLLMVGFGEGVAIAMRVTGVAHFIGEFIGHLDDFWDSSTVGRMFGLSIMSQIAAINLTPTPAGLLMAPLALAVFPDQELISHQNLSIVIIISCNMGFSIPKLPGRNHKLTLPELLLWFLPVQVIVTTSVVWWARYGRCLRMPWEERCPPF